MKTNALKIRQSFGKILKLVQTSEEPMIIEKGRQPVAVLISYDMFLNRFVDYREQEKKDKIIALAKKSAIKSTQNSTEVLRKLRYDSDY